MKKIIFNFIIILVLCFSNFQSKGDIVGGKVSGTFAGGIIFVDDDDNIVEIIIFCAFSQRVCFEFSAINPIGSGAPDNENRNVLINIPGAAIEGKHAFMGEVKSMKEHKQGNMSIFEMKGKFKAK